MSATITTLDPGVLDTEVSGHGLRPGSLRDQLDPRGTLVVFLRHLGCIFCRECVAELAGPGLRATLPPVLHVHPATVAEGEAFFARFDPLARAVSDPDCTLYEAFGVGRGRLGELFGPAVMACGFRAIRRGHGVGKVQGNPWRMPGFFLVRDGEIAWEHRSAHAGDHPDFARLAAELATPA